MLKSWNIIIELTPKRRNSFTNYVTVAWQGLPTLQTRKDEQILTSLLSSPQLIFSDILVIENLHS